MINEMKAYLAIDIGASSGRHIIGYYYDGKLKTEEIYRFKNYLKDYNGSLVWDIDYLFEQVKEGIKIIFSKKIDIISMAIDTWGVDYALLKGEEIIYPVYAYRDSRTKKYISEIEQLIPANELYNVTGIQFQEFNTIYQLYTDKKMGRLDEASDFLLIPELLSYLLTGVKTHEYTNASTTGLLDSDTKAYSVEIIKKLGLKQSLFHSLLKPGYVIGNLKPSLALELGGNTLVKLCASHDTASAVNAIDMVEDSLYISSGTWSLLGVKLKEAIKTKEARLANYSNEYGKDYIRFQKNIMGLWIIQTLSKNLNLDFVELIKLAKSTTKFQLFDVNDNLFLASNDMVNSINEWYEKNNLPRVDDFAIIANSCYHSLANSYKKAIDELESITNKVYDNIYIVGGGAKNTYLNELTAKYTKKNVIALPIEATAIGNLKAQMEE